MEIKVLQDGFIEIHDSIEKLNSESIESNKTLKDIKKLLKQILKELKKKGV